MGASWDLPVCHEATGEKMEAKGEGTMWPRPLGKHQTELRCDLEPRRQSVPDPPSSRPPLPPKPPNAPSTIPASGLCICVPPARNAVSLPVPALEHGGQAGVGGVEGRGSGVLLG